MRYLYTLMLGLCMLASPTAFAQVSPTPIEVTDWGSGFIATYEAVIQQSDVTNGVTGEWRVEVANSGASVLEMAWMETGYRADISTYNDDDGLFVLTNVGQGFIRPLNAGDLISFSVLGRGAGYKEGDLSLQFIANESTPNDNVVSGVKFTGVNDWYSPEWGGGYIASYECDIAPNATGVEIEFNYSGSGKPDLSWPDNWFGETTSGYIAPSGGFALVTNGNVPSTLPAKAQFSVLVFDAGFSESDFKITCNAGGDGPGPVDGNACSINGTQVSTGLPQSQCDALLTLFDTTNGPDWDNNSGWATATDPCTWERVECDVSATNVITLELSSNGLVGQIPAEIAQLTELKFLNLNDPGLTGPIPQELGNLANLQYLSTGLLSSLSGPIPASLGNLSNLEQLLIGGRNLSGPIPAELGNLSNLLNLVIDGTQNTGPIPPSLGSLFNLQQLSLRNMQISGPIPTEIGNLSNLETLEIANTQLTGGIPQAFNNLNALRVLRLNDNQLSGDIIGNILNVEVLDLSGNGCFTSNGGFISELLTELDPNWLDGCLPPAPGDGCSINGALVTTSLPQNQCDALVAIYNSTDGPRWSNITAPSTSGWLTATDPCSWGGITCSASPNTTRLNTVESLWLNFKGLNGVIPPQIGELTGLRVLNLGSNPGLSGTIPDEMANLINLRDLSIGGRIRFPSNMSGPIPAFLADFNQLRSLILSDNNLSGPIPPELGNLTELRRLDISRTQNTGQIPVELASLPNLENLTLAGISLTGTIPSEFGSSLFNLRIQDTQVTGEIPAELGRLPNLEYLALAGNSLSGSIPLELTELGTLVDLDLRGNQLTGSIPSELGSMPSLNRTNLSANQLTGSIPFEFGLNNQTVTLVLSDNQLTGQIPEFAQAVSLYSLEVRNNQLSGDISSLVDSSAGQLFLSGNNCFTANSTASVRLSQLDPNWQDGC